jgi:hypothetical protein
VERGGEDRRRAPEEAMPSIVKQIQWLQIFHGSQKPITPSVHGSSPQQEIQRHKVSKQSNTELTISTRLFAPTGRRIVA